MIGHQLDHLPPEQRRILDAASAAGVEFSAEGRNLSSHGLLFHADLEPPVGADMQISLSGARKNIRVVRVEPRARGGFDVASRITR